MMEKVGPPPPYQLQDNVGQSQSQYVSQIRPSDCNVAHAHMSIEMENAIKKRSAAVLNRISLLISVVTTCVIAVGMGTDHWLAEGDTIRGLWQVCTHGSGMSLCRREIARYTVTLMAAGAAVHAVCLILTTILLVHTCPLSPNNRRSVLLSAAVLYVVACMLVVGALAVFELVDAPHNAHSTLSWSFYLTCVCPFCDLTLAIMARVSASNYKQVTGTGYIRENIETSAPPGTSAQPETSTPAHLSLGITNVIELQEWRCGVEDDNNGTNTNNPRSTSATDCMSNDDGESDDDEVWSTFRGAPRRKRHRAYFINGLDPMSLERDVIGYIESRGVVVTSLTLFDRKRRRRMSGKLVVEVNEQTNQLGKDWFWPQGIKARRWVSDAKWKRRRNARN